MQQTAPSTLSRFKLADASLGFSKLQFNLDAIADGTANFQAVDQFGNVFNFNNLPLDGHGAKLLHAVLERQSGGGELQLDLDCADPEHNRP